MIVQRKRYDQEDNLVKIEFAEIYDGDTFTDANGDWYSVSMSSEGDNPKSVLLGYAHDHHIEPMSTLTIMEHFRNPKIVRLRDALADKKLAHHEWRYYDSRDWIRFMDWSYRPDGGVNVFCEDGHVAALLPDAPIKLL